MKRFKEVIIELSKNCNLNCIMCGYGAKFNNPKKFMEYSLFDNILKEIGDNAEVLRLNGRGESTIHPEFIKCLCHARTLNPNGRIRLFSNMNYNNDDITKALADCLCETMISFDSANKKNLESIRVGTHYETVIKNIEKICSNSKLTAIMFTLQPKNLFELYDVAKFAFEHRCHFFCNAVRNIEMDNEFARLVNANIDYLKKSFLEINKLFEKSNLTVHLPSQVSGVTLSLSVSQPTCADLSCCPNAGKDICIYYDGTVTPCGMFNPYVLGDIDKQSLSEIVNSLQFADFIKNQPQDPYCKNCQYICN